jgi:RNA polymerase sigma-70 factor (ECF subfamily)
MISMLRHRYPKGTSRAPAGRAGRRPTLEQQDDRRLLSATPSTLLDRPGGLLSILGPSLAASRPAAGSPAAKADSLASAETGNQMVSAWDRSAIRENPLMSATSLSLLQRLQHAKPDASGWQRLNDLYLPLIRSWLARVPGLGDEAHDLAQEVLIVLCRELPSFTRRRDGSFRAWLRRITLNRLRTFLKVRQRTPRAGLADEQEQLLARLEDPHSDLSRQWDREHDWHVFQKLLALVQPDFAPATWQAFTRFALDDCPAAQVAQELGISESAVVQAKSRVLKRLREEAGELMG